MSELVKIARLLAAGRLPFFHLGWEDPPFELAFIRTDWRFSANDEGKGAA